MMHHKRYHNLLSAPWIKLLVLSFVSIMVTACQSVKPLPVSQTHVFNQKQPNNPNAQTAQTPAVKTDRIASPNTQPPTTLANSQINNTQPKVIDPIQQAKADEAARLKKLAIEKKRQAEWAKAERQRKKRMTQAMLASQKNNADARKRVRIKNGASIPAFNRLMKLGVSTLRKNKLNTAKQHFIAAQRIAPQSPAVYMYLSEIALKQKQATKAENLARKGLVVSRSQRYDTALWRMILLSGKMRNRADVIKEATLKLRSR